MRSTILLLPLLTAPLSAATSLYAPIRSPCFESVSIRTSTEVNPAEAHYIDTRRFKKVPAALIKYLGEKAKIVYGGDLTSVHYEDLPNIALSLSGGGSRAALFAAATIKSLDGREAESVAKGTGGLLQATTYLSALSGGSWGLSSCIFSDQKRIDALVLGEGGDDAGWNLAADLFAPSNNSTLNTLYLGQLVIDLVAKVSTGLPLSRHYLPGTTISNFFNPLVPTEHGASVSFSDAVDLPSYQSYDMPFPIIVTKPYSPNNKDQPIALGLVPLTTVTYETTSIEFGSFDAQLSSFLPTKYLGTKMTAGHTGWEGCVTKFDKASLIFGASSDLFDYYNKTNDISWVNSNSSLYQGVQLFQKIFKPLQPNQQIDITAVPNPFYNINPESYEDSQETQLRLLDGGLDAENDPLGPLIAVARSVDVLLVAAAASDTTSNTPGGFSLVLSQVRAQILAKGEPINLPPLPATTKTFIEQGLNLRPSFFGCKATPSKLNGQITPAAYPLLVYIPNYDPNHITNTSTSQTNFSPSGTKAFLQSAGDIVTRGFSTSADQIEADPQWPTALACAVVERTRAKTGIDRTATCEVLFARYCWNELEGVAVYPNVIYPSTNTTTSATPPTSLLKFKDGLGSQYAPAVYAMKNQFIVDGQSSPFNRLSEALRRSCSVQHDLCADHANKLGYAKAGYTVNDCDTQNHHCESTIDFSK